ncbi:MAG: hypothetical protein ACTSRW_08495 [Candidatus Helarchaeota archaeon]
MSFFELVAVRVLMRIMLYGMKEIFNVDEEAREYIKDKKAKLQWIVDEEDEDLPEGAKAYNIFDHGKYDGGMGIIDDPDVVVHFKNAHVGIEMMRASRSIEQIRDAGDLHVEGKSELVRIFRPLMEKLKVYMAGLG